MLAQIEATPTFTTWEEYTTWVSKEKIREKIKELQTKYESIIKKVDLKEVAKTDIKIYESIKAECQKGILKELLESEE